jgi:integrase
VKPPKQEPHQRDAFSEEQMAQLLREIQGTRIQHLVPFAAYSGLRRGETLALRWEDVDIDKGTLSVERNAVPVKGGVIVQEPKTKAGKRLLTLPRPALDALRAQRDLQLTDRKAALATGEPWRNAEGYIFTTALGAPLDPKNVSRDFRKFRRRAGLPDNLPLHSLRHTAVSLRIGAGIPLEIVSKQIGHTKGALTLDQYGHLLPEADRDATDALDRYLTRRKNAKPQE